MHYECIVKSPSFVELSWSIEQGAISQLAISRAHGHYAKLLYRQRHAGSLYGKFQNYVGQCHVWYKSQATSESSECGTVEQYTSALARISSDLIAAAVLAFLLLSDTRKTTKVSDALYATRNHSRDYPHRLLGTSRSHGNSWSRTMRRYPQGFLRWGCRSSPPKTVPAPPNANSYPPRHHSLSSLLQPRIPASETPPCRPSGALNRPERLKTQ